MRPTPLEIIESVDMNRILEHGFKVKMIKTEFKTYSVDTPEDLELVKGLMKADQMIARYSNGIV